MEIEEGEATTGGKDRASKMKGRIVETSAEMDEEEEEKQGYLKQIFKK